METGFVEVDEGKIYYETNGQGPALVLIHAGFLDSRMWESQFQSYSKDYKTIRYDVRGYGRSSTAKKGSIWRSPSCRARRSLRESRPGSAPV